MSDSREKKRLFKRKIEAGDIVRIAGILIFLGFTVWMTILFSQKFNAITAGAGQSAAVAGEGWLSAAGNFLDNMMDSAQSLTEYIAENFGAYAALIFGFLQFLQVIVTAIPAAITSFASGMVYGVWGALLISIIGTALGTAVTFYLTRLLGRRVLTLFISQKNIDKMENFIDADTSTLVLFILFVIPSPKDFFPFFVGLTNMKAWKFFLISAIGRIPGMFVTCYLGATVADRNWALLIGMTVFAVTVAALFVIFNNKIMTFLKRKKTSEEAPAC